MCGSPGSGKSTFYWTKLEPLGYERVNQDTLKTVSACRSRSPRFSSNATRTAGQVCKDSIGDARGRQVGNHWYACLVAQIRKELKLEHLDNTNADQETRAVWVQLAHKFAVPVRCIHFLAHAKLCQHNDTVRALSASRFNPERRSILPHSAFAGFASRFKEPKLTEGFQDVIKVEFQVHYCSGNLVLTMLGLANTSSDET